MRQVTTPMNSSLLTRKAVWILAFTATLAATVAVVATALQQYPLPLFLIAVAAAHVAIMARDYAPRRRRWEPRLATSAESRRPYAEQRCPLAA